MARKKGGRLRDRIEQGLVPQAVRLEPRLELSGRGRVLVERHSGILEYSHERILVLTPGAVLEICGQSLIISAMNRNIVRVCGNISGVRVLEE